MNTQLSKILVVITVIVITMTMTIVYKSDKDKLVALDQVSEQKHEVSKEPVPIMSITGEKNHRIKEPLNVITDNKGNIYVADREAGKILVFNQQGIFLRSIGKKGIGAGQFSYPYGLVCFPGNRIWVSDCENKTVQEFDIKGNFIKTIISEKENIVPGFITMDLQNSVYISDLSGKRILVYNEAGQMEKDFKANFLFPQGIVLDKKKRLWIADAGTISSLKVVNKEGILEDSLELDKNNNPYFCTLRGLAVDSKDRIYAVNALASNVSVFDNHGNFLFKFGNYGSSEERFNLPTGIYIDKHNKIFIADRANKRIQIYGYEEGR